MKTVRGHMTSKSIRRLLASLLISAGPALGQPPPGHHIGPYIGPNLPSGLPTTPGWPPSGTDQFPQHPGFASGVKSAPGVDESAGMPPLFPPYLGVMPRQLPADRTTTPPASLLKAVVADRIRLLDDTKPPSKLAGVEVELTEDGGYRVTKKYEDYSSVLDDGRPRYIWDMTFYIGAGEIRVSPPAGTQPDPARPPAPPFHGLPGTSHQPLDIVIDPKDPFGFRDAQIDQLRREQQLRQMVNDGLLQRHVRERQERADEILSDESLAEMEAIIAAAGWASLQTALTVGTLVPVAGTVIEGGTAFHDQYYRTRDTLLKNGIGPAEAHRRAFLQALVVGGVAVGADLATGSVLGRLKTVAKFKAFDKSAAEFIAEAARKGQVSGKNVGLVKQGLDTAVDQAAVATGKGTIGTTTAIATTLVAGGFGGGGYRPAIAQRPAYGGNSYGANFRLP